MKNNKKFGRVALVVALLVVVCIASIGGTIAWLTDKTGTVTNTFTTSNIGITLTEGGKTATETAPVAATFKMVPGNVIDKDPKVTIEEGSEPCWVFVKVEKSSNLDTYITYGMADGWIQYKDSEENVVAGVYYRTAGEIAEDGTVTLVGEDWTKSVIGYTPVGGEFVNDKVLVKTGVTKDQMDSLTDTTQPTLTFKAAAVQMANVDVHAAYDEVDDFLNPTTTP